MTSSSIVTHHGIRVFTMFNTWVSLSLLHTGYKDIHCRNCQCNPVYYSLLKHGIMEYHIQSFKIMCVFYLKSANLAKHSFPYSYQDLILVQESTRSQSIKSTSNYKWKKCNIFCFSCRFSTTEALYILTSTQIF